MVNLNADLGKVVGSAVVGHLLYATGGSPATSDNEVYQP